jgi:glyoxylase I family protein
LGDGSFVAFFDLGDDVAPAPSPNTPAWVNHLALRVDGIETLERTKTLLEAAGIDVLGVTDHRIFKSIYFFDPNGIRLELCAQIASEPQMIEESLSSHERLAEWTMRKQRWRADRIEAEAAAQSSHTD